MRLHLTLLCSVFSCATVRSPSASPPGVQHWAEETDWAAANDETVTLLSDFLRVDTTNPPGNEARGAQFLKAFLARHDVSSTLSEFAPGRSSLVARLTAQGQPTAKPLCLLSHLDVVSAEPAQWPADAQPLSGVVKDGALWGRGALDMKGMGAIEAMTLVLLKRAKVPLTRDVLLLAVGDEEVDSQGMRDLLERHWRELDCGVVINEGGIGLRGLFAPGQTVFPITVAEKGTLWLRLTAAGEAGHGSTPTPTRAPTRLQHALELLERRATTPVISAALFELLRRVGEAGGGLQGFVLQHPTLVRAFAMTKLLASPPTRAAMTNTCQVTGFEGKGSAPNVVPSSVSAIIDCRVLPGVQPEQLLAELRALLAELPGVTLEVLHQSVGSSSSWDDPFFAALERQLRRGHPEVVVGPALSPGFTDSNLLRPKGVTAYGLVPFALDAELLGTMHGANERVPLSELKSGLQVLFRAVLDVAAAP